MKVYIETLGCKVNFADSSYIASILVTNNFCITERPEDADIFIINSCSVTHRAERECRQLARRFHSIKSDALIIITGCSLLSKSFKEKINDISFAKLIHINDISSALKLISSQEIEPYFNRARPFIKIQEGCDRFCSYCIVPYLRGKPKSISSINILSQINNAINKGYQEIVLVGTHIMLYKDPLTSRDIYGLLNDIDNIKKEFRIRISSIEPYGITIENIKFLSTLKKLCQHFHIPLQHGSDKILKDMNRGYSTSDFLNIVSSIKDLLPDSTIGTDIITGFPTETEEDFEKTLRFLKIAPIDYYHVFRFSPREGTPAASIKSVSTQSDIKRRSKILLKNSFDKRREMVKKYIGKEMDIIITEDSGQISGLTHNYIQVFINNNNVKRGRLYRAHLLSLNDNNTISGEIV